MRPCTPEQMAARVTRLEGEIAALQSLVRRLQQEIKSRIEAARASCSVAVLMLSLLCGERVAERGVAR